MYVKPTRNRKGCPGAWVFCPWCVKEKKKLLLKWIICPYQNEQNDNMIGWNQKNFEYYKQNRQYQHLWAPQRMHIILVEVLYPFLALTDLLSPSGMFALAGSSSIFTCVPYWSSWIRESFSRFLSCYQYTGLAHYGLLDSNVHFCLW